MMSGHDEELSVLLLELTRLFSSQHFCDNRISNSEYVDLKPRATVN